MPHPGQVRRRAYRQPSSTPASLAARRSSFSSPDASLQFSPAVAAPELELRDPMSIVPAGSLVKPTTPGVQQHAVGLRKARKCAENLVMLRVDADPIRRNVRTIKVGCPLDSKS